MSSLIEQETGIRGLKNEKPNDNAATCDQIHIDCTFIGFDWWGAPLSRSHCTLKSVPRCIRYKFMWWKFSLFIWCHGYTLFTHVQCLGYVRHKDLYRAYTTVKALLEDGVIVYAVSWLFRKTTIIFIVSYLCWKTSTLILFIWILWYLERGDTVHTVRFRWKRAHFLHTVALVYNERTRLSKPCHKAFLSHRYYLYIIYLYRKVYF